ncbi:MAG: GNAT family N-acetyltransferase [Clostridia bacterium]|nr:GNAT family N-acetyltransferase [Clostridia bacterium]
MRKNEITHLFAKTEQLASERLLFRKMQKKDASDMFDYAKRPEVTRYLLWHEHPDLTYTKRYLAFVEACYRTGKFFDLAVIHRESNRMIGTCGFAHIDFSNNAAELGYVLHPDFWNCGIATEAASRILQYGFEVLGLHRIEARYMKDNLASRRVMEKCGMRFEGIQRGLMQIKGRYEDIGVFAKTEED